MGCSNSTSQTYLRRHSVVCSPEEAMAECAHLLKTTPLFATLSNEDLTGLIEKAGNTVYKKGEKVARQGENGNKFFVILAGSVEVTKETSNPSTDYTKKETLGSLARGDFFGEEAMAPRCYSRPTTVAATSELEVLVISKTLFDSLGLGAKVDFGNAKLSVQKIVSDLAMAKLEHEINSNSTEAS